ncbi:MAG: protease modulator HflK [Verrucomicrobia subdivision 3 bacterium]|nr:protease modulator HflK [Limisphaerales bacterium]
MSDSTDILDPPRKSAPESPPPELPEDVGSQALSEALKSSFAIVKIVLIIMVLVFLGSGFFIVGTQEKAIILRLGKPVGKDEKALLGPGAHWAFPYPIDEVVRIPVGQVQTIRTAVGWYQTSAAMEAAGTPPLPQESLNPAVDGYALTGDGNIMHVRGTLRYRIAEPGLQFAFNFANASNTVLNAFNNALIYASASYRVDDALTRDVSGFRERVRTRLEATIARDKLGILVDQVGVDRAPPVKLAPVFVAVSEAEAKRGKELDEARSYASEIVNRAKGEAAIRVATGQSDKTRRVEFVAAEARRFSGLLPEYEKNPELFRRMRQLETLQRIFTNAQVEKIMLPTSSGGKPPEIRVQIEREREKPRTVQPQKAEEH